MVGNKSRRLRGKAGTGVEAGTKKETTIGVGDIILAKETLGDDDIRDLDQGTAGTDLVIAQENIEGPLLEAERTRENRGCLKVETTGSIEIEVRISLKIIGEEDKAIEMDHDHDHHREKNFQNPSADGAIVREEVELHQLRRKCEDIMSYDSRIHYFLNAANQYLGWALTPLRSIPHFLSYLERC